MTVNFKLDGSGQQMVAVADESGWRGATLKVFTNPKGLFSMIATVSDVVGYVVSNQLTSLISSQSRYVGGAIGAFPETISELASGLPAVFSSQRGSKAYASALKGFAGLASVGPTLAKMNIINLSAGVIKKCNGAKSLLDVASAVSNCFYQFVAKPREIAANVDSSNTAKPWVIRAERELNQEKFAAQIKAIVGLGFFSFLAIGTLFSIALSPIAVTGLGSLYMITVIGAIYADSFKTDAIARQQAAFFNGKSFA